MMEIYMKVLDKSRSNILGSSTAEEFEKEKNYKLAYEKLKNKD
jgi:hypothetical protein